MSGLIRCRRVVPCPDCGTPLRWSRSATVANIGAAFTVYFTTLAALDPWPRQFVFFAVAAAAMALAELAQLRVQGFIRGGHGGLWHTAYSR